MGPVEQFFTHHGPPTFGAFQFGALHAPLMGYFLTAPRAHTKAAGSEPSTVVSSTATARRTHSATATTTAAAAATTTAATAATATAAATATHSSTTRHDASFSFVNVENSRI
jgi:hypothetical protein